MRIVALEEHLWLAPFNAELDKATERSDRGGAARVREKLEDVDGARLTSMDESGITLQVLSVPGFGAALLPPDAAPSFARRYNDALAVIVRARPDRFATFAHLPLTAPDAAADELERTVREFGFRGALISGTPVTAAEAAGADPKMRVSILCDRVPE